MIIYRLNTMPVPTVVEVGGKALSLIQMSAANLPIPPGFVLTTGAYDAYVDEKGLRQRIIELEAAASAGDASPCECTSAAIGQLFRADELPQAVQAGLLAASLDLVREGDTDSAGEPQSRSHKQLAASFAVRSSATVEDLPDASFAGQYDTFLNVQGPEALLEAVVRCWASLWSARAIAYRRRQGIDPAAVSMAVVVQQLVPASSAGILFTANPVGGERDQILSTPPGDWARPSWAGWSPPIPWSWTVRIGTVLSRETATKTTMTVRAETGTEERPVPPEQQDQTVLDDATAIELARLAPGSRRISASRWISNGRLSGEPQGDSPKGTDKVICQRRYRHPPGAAHHQFAARPVGGCSLGSTPAGHHLDAAPDRRAHARAPLPTI